jgi:hypothetical protein
MRWVKELRSVLVAYGSAQRLLRADGMMQVKRVVIGGDPGGRCYILAATSRSNALRRVVRHRPA